MMKTVAFTHISDQDVAFLLALAQRLGLEAVTFDTDSTENIDTLQWQKLLTDETQLQKLDALAAKALQAHRTGKTKPLDC
ncbi:MAG: hypothetical protein ACOVQA_05685 [Thermoflexibacteraceae bacterium]|jgi:hypothetical protein